MSEFRRWLKQQGATFAPGTRHEKVYLNGKQTVLSNHANEDLKTGTLNAIKKQLGLK